MNFNQSEQYLYSLGNEVEAMKLGLANIETLLGALGDPQKKYFKVQVAGTNGKGSVCAFLDSICRSAGIEVGLYTSPHLVSITERVKINGVEISEEKFAQIGTQVREIAEHLLEQGALKYTPTFFEQMTAIALLAFADSKVSLAILETGLGGRLDAVTAAKAEIAAITRIDLDHQEYLGETIEEIAAEKAAIIRADMEAVVVGNQRPEALAAIEKRIRGADGRKPSRSASMTGGASILLARTNRKPFRTSRMLAPPVVHSLPLGLKGDHQVENARTAVGIVQALRKHFAIADADIHTGLETTRHPGRLEYIGNCLLDGAHNIGGAQALAKYLDEFETRPITLIFGAMADKNVGGMMEILVPRATNVILTRANNSRAMSADELLEHVPSGFPRDRITLIDLMATAVKSARDISPDGSLIVTAGSLYLVGEARQILKFQI